MTLSYNLIDEPWIPVTDPDGRVVEWGLRETLAHAHILKSVAAPTALETAAILRLLLAILHRTHDTSSQADWARIWQRGQFDAEALESYWQTWRQRFDLFDPERPFYQTKEERKKAVSIAAFYPGLAASDHYNHTVQLEEAALTPAEAARGLLVAQTFGLSGGCLPSEKLSHKNSPWVAGMIFLVEADSLFQTLASNLLRYDETHPSIDLCHTSEDRPNWEADNPYQAREHALGYLDYLTWPSRGIKLKPELQGDRIVVRTYVDYVGIAPPEVLDPFKFYRKDDKTKNKTGHVALYLNLNRATWRNASTILRLHRDTLRPPVVLTWLAELRRKGAIRSPRARLCGYGLVVENQTKVILMRRDALPLPLIYLDQEGDAQNQMDLLGRLDIALTYAEQTGKSLTEAIFRIAKEIYPRPGGKSEDRLNSDQRGQVDRIASSISTQAEYWGGLERPFDKLVVELAEGGELEQVQQRWLEEVVSAARAALAESERRAGQNPKALKAGVQARRFFEWKLRDAGLVPAAQLSQGVDREETTV